MLRRRTQNQVQQNSTVARQEPELTPGQIAAIERRNRIGRDLASKRNGYVVNQFGGK